MQSDAMAVDSAPKEAEPYLPGTIVPAADDAARSIEGWIVMVSNVHEEASEDDLQDLMGEYGQVKSLHLNLDRRTGYVKGYVLVEYDTREEAQAAIDGASGSQLLEQVITVDFAFIRPPTAPVKAAPRRDRSRSRSPEREDLIKRID